MSVSGLRSTIWSKALLPAALIAASSICAPAALAQNKVAIVNFQRAVIETAEMKKAAAELQSKYKPRQDQLEKLQRDMADIQAKLQGAQGAPANASELQLEGTRKQREAQRISEDLQADAERDRNEILQRGTQRMTEVVKKLADEKGLDMVFDSTNAIFFKPSFEITEEAVAAYDKTYPAK